MERTFRLNNIALAGAVKPAFYVAAISAILGRNTMFQTATVFLVVFLMCFARIKSVKIVLHKENIVISKGVFIKSKKSIPASRVLGISAVERPIAKLFLAVRVYISTAISEKRFSEINLVVSEDSAKELVRFVFGEAAPDFKLNAPKSLLAALSSAAAVGLAAGLPILAKIAPFFSRAFVSKNGKKEISIGETVFISGTHKLTFKQICCRRSALSEVKVAQGFLDGRRDTCTLQLSVKTSKKKKAKIRRIECAMANEIIEKILTLE